jgi:hypothetical protein
VGLIEGISGLKEGEFVGLVEVIAEGVSEGQLVGFMVGFVEGGIVGLAVVGK